MPREPCLLALAVTLALLLFRCKRSACPACNIRDSAATAVLLDEVEKMDYVSVPTCCVFRFMLKEDFEAACDTKFSALPKWEQCCARYSLGANHFAKTCKKWIP